MNQIPHPPTVQNLLEDEDDDDDVNMDKRDSLEEITDSPTKDEHNAAAVMAKLGDIENQMSDMMNKFTENNLYNKPSQQIPTNDEKKI